MDHLKRCQWCDDQSQVYRDYHDKQWGIPVYEDETLFEMLLLESFQAGLSWITILKKRDAFYHAFDGFNPQIISGYGQVKEAELMENKGIIRNRLKIKSAIGNAKVFLEIQKEYGSFSAYLWGHTKGEILVNRNDDLPVSNALSHTISADLKKRGMKFVGTVIIYSYLQAVGVINDHQLSCFRHPDNQ